MVSTGVVGLVANGATKVFSIVNQTEPDFFGIDFIGLLRSTIMGVGTEASVKAQIAAMVSTPGRQITQAELDGWRASHPAFSTITTIPAFYAKLASIQGDIATMLSFGVYEDYVTYTADPGFTQVDWGYVADFDARLFEIYRGSQVAPPTRGRLVGLGLPSNPNLRQLYPMQMVGQWTYAQVALIGAPTRWWAN